MPSFAFAKVHPGGNTTVILTDCVLEQKDLAGVSAILIDPLHLGAEQVGALSQGGTKPHLQMMGGEFCVNAARSAALLLARAGRLRPAEAEGCLSGQLTVSGALSPVDVLVGAAEEPLMRALSPGRHRRRTFPANPPPAEASRLFCAASMNCGAGSARILPAGPGLHLVHLPGICHLLADSRIRPMPRNWRAGSADLRLQAGIANAPASGVVWYECEGDACRITPAVEVKATASEHLETACGSASMAMALLRETLPAAPERLSVIQPSGETLKVTLIHESPPDSDLRFPDYAWVSGRVALVAEGLVHL